MANEEIRVQNMEKVLGIAHQCFLEVGIEKTTQEMIARRSGLSLRTVTRFFSSKVDMVVQVAEYMMRLVYSGFPVPATMRLEMEKSGYELLGQYAQHIKQSFAESPKTYVLRAEFDLYFFRHGVFEAEAYQRILKIGRSRPILHEIFRLGQADGSICIRQDVETEVNIFCNALFGPICLMATKCTTEQQTLYMLRQLDLRTERLLASYRSA